MIAVSLDRVGLPLLAITGVVTAPGGFALPPLEAPAEFAPIASPPTAKVATIIDVSHLMVPVDLLPLARVVEAQDAAAMDAPIAESVPPVAGVAAAALPGAGSVPPPAAEPSRVAPPVVEAASTPIRHHTGSTTASTAIRRHKLADCPIAAVATLNQALPPLLVPQGAVVPGRVSPDAVEIVATPPKEVAGSPERHAVMPMIDLPLAPTEGSSLPTPTLIPSESAGTPVAIGSAPPVDASHTVEPPARAEGLAAVAISIAQPVAQRLVGPTIVQEPSKTAVRAELVDSAAFLPGMPVSSPEPQHTPSGAKPRDLAAALAPAARVTDPAPVIAAAPIPEIAPAIMAVTLPQRPAAPTAQRDQHSEHEPRASHDRSDPPIYTIVAPSPSLNSAVGAHRPVSLSSAPAPARPADFAIDTPSLGAVGAEVTRRDHLAGDALHVHFAVDRSGTAALIAGASEGLERAVVATGNRLDAVTIEVRGGSTGTAAGTGSDTASGAGHRGDAPQHRSSTPPQPASAPSTRVRSPVIKPIVRDRFA